MSIQDQEYIRAKEALITGTETRLLARVDSHKFRFGANYPSLACRIIINTFEGDEPARCISLIKNPTFVGNLTNCVGELLMGGAGANGYLDDNAAESFAIKNLLRKDQHYIDFVAASSQILQPDVQVAAQRATPNFNWTKLALFAAPPVGVVAAYTGAAIKDAATSADSVKAMNDFFAANAADIATISAAYYAVLLVAYFVCRNRAPVVNSVENNNHHEPQ